MGFFDKIFGRKKDNINWEETKLSGDAYPANSISILRVKTKTGKSATGWVNKTYNQYIYKEFCPWHFLITIDLDDSIVINNPDLDMGAIQSFFVNGLRKAGVAHIVARMVTDDGMNIDMYVENDQPAMEYLDKIIADPARLVSFKYAVTKDPEWQAVNHLMNQ